MSISIRLNSSHYTNNHSIQYPPMQTEMLHLRIPTDEIDLLKKSAAKCRLSANALGAEIIRAGIAAVKDYDGPIIPMTLEFPHKVKIPTKIKK